LLDAIDDADLVEDDEITYDVARLILDVFSPVIYLNCLDVKERVEGSRTVTVI
jgi:hypothetical protein